MGRLTAANSFVPAVFYKAVPWLAAQAVRLVTLACKHVQEAMAKGVPWEATAHMLV